MKLKSLKKQRMLIFDVKLLSKNIQNNYRTNVLKQLDFIKKNI